MKLNRRALWVVLCFAVGALRATILSAGGPYTDELSKCLVKSTTEADKTLLVQWIFAMASLHPAVKSMSALSEAQRTEISRQAAAMMEHLLTVSCQAEAQQALKYEGNGALEASFNVLGQVAARELFASPEVAAGLTELGKFVDETKLKAALQGGN
jgi:hypothetical protein